MQLWAERKNDDDFMRALVIYFHLVNMFCFF